MRLQNKIAVITGSSSGIGAGVARAFALEGAQVVVNYPTRAQKADAEAVAHDSGGIAVQADVALETECQTLFDQAISEFGRVDILVNNAGIAHSAPVEDIPIAMWDRMFAVHVRSMFLMTRLALPGMYSRASGKIINTASQLAYRGSATFAHYTACKGAILSFTRSLALEVGDRGINVNAVAPGATKTPILADVPDEVLEFVRKGIPLGRLAEIEDIVPSYVFLASDDARHYQGQCISPNGGDVFL
jgi:3-oxoacyl-[acyl-carrier protein] reductase